MHLDAEAEGETGSGGSCGPRKRTGLYSKGKRSSESLCCPQRAEKGYVNYPNDCRKHLRVSHSYYTCSCEGGGWTGYNFPATERCGSLIWHM